MSASAGRVLLIPRGAYVSTETYAPLDLVYYQGSTYVCKATSQGNLPTDTDYFQIFAQGSESASAAGNYYGTCDTAAATAAKEVTIPAAENFVLQLGDIIGIKFDETNTASNATLNVNSTGAKHIYYSNAALTTSNLFAGGEAGRITTYMYDGTNWVWTGHDLDDTTDDTKVPLEDMAVEESSPSTAVYRKGDFLYYGSVLYEVLGDIDVGDALVVGTNIQAAVLSESVARQEFEAAYGLCTKTTVIGEDASGNTRITETDTGKSITAVTTIAATSSTVTTITTVVTPAGGDYYWTKTTTITNGTTIAETYTRTAQS